MGSMSFKRNLVSSLALKTPLCICWHVKVCMYMYLLRMHVCMGAHVGIYIYIYLFIYLFI